MAEVGQTSTNGKQLSAKVLDGPPPSSEDAFSVSSKLFADQFGEELLQTLDVDRWRLGNDLDQEYQRIEREVREAEKIETVKDRQIREELFPQLLAVLPNTICRRTPACTKRHQKISPWSTAGFFSTGAWRPAMARFRSTRRFL